MTDAAVQRVEVLYLSRDKFASSLQSKRGPAVTTSRYLADNAQLATFN